MINIGHTINIFIKLTFQYYSSLYYKDICIILRFIGLNN